METEPLTIELNKIAEFLIGLDKDQMALTVSEAISTIIEQQKVISTLFV